MLGLMVVGAMYAESTLSAVARRPMRMIGALALALALLIPAAVPVTMAASNPREAVIDAALSYVGHPFRLGSEGPRYFDCSGFVFRAFADAGQLTRISGARRRAAQYTSWFHQRGRYSRSATQAERGDLVAYTNGRRIAHIGIYLGNGKVVSALTSGVTVHRLRGINMKLSHVLKVNWGGRSGTDASDGPDTTRGPNHDDGQPEPDRPPLVHGGEHPDGLSGIATGAVNLRTAADPSARVIGVVGRGSRFRIVGHGTSPAGYLWYEIRTSNGKAGWIYSRWVDALDD